MEGPLSAGMVAAEWAQEAACLSTAWPMLHLPMSTSQITQLSAAMEVQEQTFIAQAQAEEAAEVIMEALAAAAELILAMVAAVAAEAVSIAPAELASMAAEAAAG